MLVVETITKSANEKFIIYVSIHLQLCFNLECFIREIGQGLEYVFYAT